MVFSSLVFLYMFLPAVLLCYFVLPKSWRIPVLLLFSLLFYGWGEPLYLAVMLFSIALNFLFGALVGRFRESKPKRAKLFLALSVIINLALLCFFKYADFILENIALIPGLTQIKPLGVALPIGISFYTFQSMSYSVDVYRGDAPVQRSFTKFAAYVSLFPQLIAGPIVRYKTIADQLDSREESLKKFQSGVVMFVIGLSKKVLLGNSFGQLFESFSALPADERSVLGAWIGIIAFTLQIYFDFGGYSDMAVGLGRMFGFEFQKNFDYPYRSKSITEFWSKRWHISLGTWFREYLYFPLGGSRVKVPRMVINLFIVWFLTGLWHGASWNFAIWGLYYAVLLTVEKLFLAKPLKAAPAWIANLYAFFFVVIGWVIFSITDLNSMLAYMGNLFGLGGSGLVDREALYALTGWLPLFAVGAVACTPLFRDVFRRFRERTPKLYIAAEAALVLIAVVLCTAYIVDASYNPFLYFRF